MGIRRVFYSIGTNREKLMEQLGDKINNNHPQLEVEEVPTGWCSWYCFGPNVTEKDIYNNMEVITEKLSELKYIQIDDGYQAHMGDWLIPGSSFTSDMKQLCKKIKDKGFIPAIWVAPFIAEKDSRLFKEHPDWFVKDEKDKPLLSSKVSFGGWRRGPWYMLDGTHPAAQSYLRKVFQTMREEWNCTYFKLDANMWGALHGGYHYDQRASRIEAYRLGMKAIIEGAGKDSFILGCNAPMWPSLGLVHGMRVTNDISRSWDRFKIVAKELFWRNWQHNKLWINDPDCVVLNNSVNKVMGPDGKEEVKQKTHISEDEFIFHATMIYASGGMVLAGDDICQMTKEKIKILKKLLPPTNIPAKFDDSSFQIGRIKLKDSLILCLFNWDDNEINLEIDLDAKYRIEDMWKEKDLGEYEGKIKIEGLPAHSAKILICRV